MYLSSVDGRGGIYAKVVAASVCNDVKLWTLETCAPKHIDAEYEKHRMLSSSSSSSRALPFKMPDPVYLPIELRKQEKGMQGYENLAEPDEQWSQHHLEVLSRTVYKNLAAINYLYGPIHKQHLNRYMEPWTFQKKVTTATEWENFFRLRLAPDAQPEIQELARCMEQAMKEAESLITELKPGECHLPYVKPEELEKDCGADLSAARCARVSFMNHDNTAPDPLKDLELVSFLLSSKHMTPFEHQASPMILAQKEFLYDTFIAFEKGVTHMDRKHRFWSGNFRGWIQNRQLIEDWNE